MLDTEILLTVHPPERDHGAPVMDYVLNVVPKSSQAAMIRLNTWFERCSSCVHGQCNSSSRRYSCNCTPGFAGRDCDTCAPQHFVYPVCRFCEGSSTCNGHGRCSSAGLCQCSPGFSGAACDSCRPSLVGYPHKCTYCDAEVSCNGHGTCDPSSAACVCSGDYYGVDCKKHCSTDTSCSGHGACSSDGEACLCEVGWTGRTCSGWNNVTLKYLEGRGKFDLFYPLRFVLHL